LSGKLPLGKLPLNNSTVKTRFYRHGGNLERSRIPPWRYKSGAEIFFFKIHLYHPGDIDECSRLPPWCYNFCKLYIFVKYNINVFLKQKIVIVLVEKYLLSSKNTFLRQKFVFIALAIIKK